MPQVQRDAERCHVVAAAPENLLREREKFLLFKARDRTEPNCCAYVRP